MSACWRRPPGRPPHESWLLALILAGGLVYAALYLFDLQFAAGEVYPEYSTLRTDPKGARLLYDSLARTARHHPWSATIRALEFLPDGVTVFLLAIQADDFGNNSEPYLRVLEQSARRGNRMVATLTLLRTASSPKFEELAKRWNVQLALDDKVRRHSLYFTQCPRLDLPVPPGRETDDDPSAPSEKAAWCCSRRATPSATRL